MRLPHAFVLAAALLVPLTASAQDESLYAQYFGDGMRAYTEARYSDALEQLYRAYAVRQTPYALKLILRSHDFQGNCSARDRATELLLDSFPDESVPAPQVCAKTGTVQLTCSSSTAKVRINGNFLAQCGSTVRLPVGEHTVESIALPAVKERVTVRADDTIEVTILPSPTKWYLGDARPQKWLRLNDSVPSELGKDPDMPRTFDVRKWRPTDR